MHRNALFKSCDYCRHRKKKCISLNDADPSARCADCEHLDLPCEFSLRRPSLKRRQNSRRVAARLGDTVGDSRWLQPTGGVASTEGSSRQARVEKSSTAYNKILLPRGEEDAGGHEGFHTSTKERYIRDVYPFLPFVPLDLLEDNRLDEGCILQSCVDWASLMSLNRARVQCIPSIETLEARLRQGHLSLGDAAGVLLMIPCVSLDSAIVEKVFDTIESTNETYSVPQPILAGAISSHAWRQLAGLSRAPLNVPTEGLHAYAQSLDSTLFSHHYLLLAGLAIRFEHLRKMTDLHGIRSETQMAWAKLEYECLLWQVRLPSNFLDLRDELPATPESIVFHSLSNLMLLSLYSYILGRSETLGNLLALRPVPGVLYLVCALARSCFICPREISDRWTLIVDIQAVAARTMLSLWHQTKFENCRAVLSLWKDVGDRYADLAQEVCKDVGSGPWTVNEMDGYSVFWTYRDLRTLTLELICGDRL